MKAQDKLYNKIKEQKHICVGLDSDPQKIPAFLRNEADGVLKFNKAIIEQTKDLAAAYKLNLAFYEITGRKGYEDLERTIELMPEDVLIIGDAKRGDIGNTSEMYAKSVFEHFKFDATTLHPYMGYDSLKPFIEFDDKISFILALTSNPGSADFEKQLLSDQRFLYQHVIQKSNEWNVNKNLGIVFGATNPEELSNEIKNFGALQVLLPGVGAQGGSIQDVVSTFHLNGNYNFLINVSRGIIFKDSSENFALTAHDQLIEYNLQINKIIND